MSDNILTSNVSKEQLQKIIERVEKLEEEKTNITEDMKEVFKEASHQGFDISIIKKVLRLRKMDNTKREEEDYLVDLYRKTLGI